MDVVVIGPMSSGCRLLRRIINASPNATCWLDTSHGTDHMIENGLYIPDAAKVVVILRDPKATNASRESHWAGTDLNIPYEDSLVGIRSRYPNAHIVCYEELCSDPKREIEKIADYLNIPVWEYDSEKIENMNGKWIKTS